MSTENDPTMPVPTTRPSGATEPAGPAGGTGGTGPGGPAGGTGPAGPTAPIRRSAVGEAPDEHPTTPVPRSDARHTEPLTRPLPTTAGTPTQSLGAPAASAAGGTAASADRPAERPAGRPAELPADRPGPSADPVAVRTGAVEDADARAARPSLRVGTVVWGLVLAVIGAGIIAVAAGAQIDVELALIGLLALAGMGLVVGSVVTGVRRRH